MKSSKIRKIQRAICADKSRITSDIQRISDMQQKVNDNYDWFKKYNKLVGQMNLNGRKIK